MSTSTIRPIKEQTGTRTYLLDCMSCNNYFEHSRKALLANRLKLKPTGVIFHRGYKQIKGEDRLYEKLIFITCQNKQKQTNKICIMVFKQKYAK